eukprot:SAG31_NODE_919_length_11010_cov_27.449821_4_plen_99_part_00
MHSGPAVIDSGYGGSAAAAAHDSRRRPRRPPGQAAAAWIPCEPSPTRTRAALQAALPYIAVRHRRRAGEVGSGADCAGKIDCVLNVGVQLKTNIYADN